MWQPEQPPSQTVASLRRAHCFFSRVGDQVRQRTARSLAPSRRRSSPCRKSAPVGQACTHLPHEVQVGDVAPGLVQVGDDPGVDAAAGDVPGVRALDLVADPDAARAEDAAVVVDAEPLVAECPPRSVGYR